jgi:hypothetical protein
VTSVYVGVDEEGRVEDLERLMRVERDDCLRDQIEVVVDERAEPAAVVERPRPRTTCHEELEPGRAEGVLGVDGEEADAGLVARRS